jgi:HrpA-like RNA helicase
MSATLDAELFAQYFNGCPTMHAEGRTFPVQQVRPPHRSDGIGPRPDDTPLACSAASNRTASRSACVSNLPHQRTSGSSVDAKSSFPFRQHSRVGMVSGFRPKPFS